MNVIRRDLNADLAFCNAATPGPWRVYGGKFGEMNVYAYPYGNDDEIVSDIDFGRNADAAFIAEARTGWPYVIERAIAAERELPAARALLIDMRRRAECAEAEVERYRTALQSIYRVASADGIAPELDRCYAIAANALMGSSPSILVGNEL